MRTMHAYYACVACMRICHVCIQAAPNDFVNFANMLTQYTRDEINNLDWHAFWENVRSGRGVLSMRSGRGVVLLSQVIDLLEAHYIDDSCALIICHYHFFVLHLSCMVYYACALCMRSMHAHYACVLCMRIMHV